MDKLVPFLKNDMKNKIIKKLENIQEYSEEGIKELGREEGIEFSVYNTIKPKKVYIPEYVALFQDMAQKFSKEFIFTGTEYRLLFYLISLVGYQNFIGIDIKSIAENLGIHEKTVSRGIAKLVEINIVIKMDNMTDKRRNDYFVNMDMFWKGSPQTRLKVKKKLENKHGLNVLELPFKG